MLIAGAVSFAGPAWLAAQRERIAGALGLGHGGAVATWSEDSAALFHRAAGRGSPGRLPLARGWRPALTAGGERLAFCGQIFDRAALRASIGPKAAQAADDAGLYALALEVLGSNCDSEIVGQYAVVSWHDERRVLRAARSGVRAPPLYWWRSGAQLVVASTPRAIAAAGATLVLAYDRLDDALLMVPPDPTATWYKDLHKVAPGTVVTWTQDGLKECCFWAVEKLAPVGKLSLAEAAEEATRLFAKGTREMLADFSRPAIMLSGGLDSQAVASFALEVVPGRRLDGYVGVPRPGATPEARPNSLFDELPGALALADMHPDLRVHPVDGAAIDRDAMIASLIMLTGLAPLNFGNLDWIFALYQRARDDGCDVMLTGDMGNSTFSYSGETALPYWFRSGRWARLVSDLAADPDPRPLWHKLIGRAVLPNLPTSWRTQVSRWRNPGAGPLPAWTAMRADFALASGALDRADRAGHDLNFLPSRSALDWRRDTLAMFAADAPDVEQGFTMLFGMPDRDPTSYRPLVEFCAALPEDVFRAGGQSRMLARHMLIGRVPESVRGERRLGRQGADWPVRLIEERTAILVELELWRGDPDLGPRLDIDRLIARLEAWDGSDHLEQQAEIGLWLPLARALAAGRFSRYVSGRND